MTAKDKATNREQKISITASTNLNKQDIDKMVQEAQRNAANDQKRKELADARNVGDNTAYQVEKTLRDMGDKVKSEDRGNLENLIRDVRDAVKTDDMARIKRVTETLQQAAMKLGESAYGAGAPGAGRQMALRATQANRQKMMAWLRANTARYSQT